MRGCSTNEVKKGEISKMFLRLRFDVCALSETKLKGKGEVMFGEVVGRVSGVARGRAREGVALLLSVWLMRCVVEWKEVLSRLMWARVKIERQRERERESWVFIMAYGPGSEKSEEEIEEFWNELSEYVGSFGRNESVIVLGDSNDRVGNEVIEEMLVGMECQEEMKVVNDYWRCVQSRS